MSDPVVVLHIEDDAPSIDGNSPTMILDSNNDQKDTLQCSSVVVVPNVSWFHQIKYAMKKNWILLYRSPMMLSVMLFSSVIGVLLCWAIVGNKIDETLFPPVDECGIITQEYYNTLSSETLYDTPVSLNSKWNNGVPIAFLSLGPFLFGCCVFLFIHEELHTHLFEVLASTSLCDSAYWVSWYIPFFLLAIMNSILGGITAKFVPIHVMENTYFGGIFASFLFLHITLISASMLLAVVLGTAKRGVSFIILLMFVALWVPPLYYTIQGSYQPQEWSSYIQEYSSVSSPGGLFWTYGTTNRLTQVYDFNTTTGNETIINTTCTMPIMTQEQGLLSKTMEEQALVPDNEFFVGCYVTAGIVNIVWDTKTTMKSNFYHFLLYSIPYFEFSLLWGNFLGTTSQPGHTFTKEHFTMSPEQLASTTIQSNNNNNINNNPTTGFVPQYSTLNIDFPWEYYYSNGWFGGDDGGGFGDDDIKSNCPNVDRTGYNFCNTTSSWCYYAKNSVETQSKSCVDLIFILLLQSYIFIMLAAYIAIVRIGTRSQLHKWYFPLQPSYWFPNCRNTNKNKNKNASLSTVTNDTYVNGVAIQDISKVYGSNQAVNNVTFQMIQGEVTALLGHNGAGKTTLSHILCCEQKASRGDATVFGYSVTDDPGSVQKLVGICKQDDYLWSLLTAKEHLELFAGLRGVPAPDIPSTVQTWLESVDLDNVQRQYAGSFSGGMKRRLSVSLATIGQSQKFIVLDEPTTGMDPVSRRSVWRHLENVKHDRTILITTHAMEEADLLADTVAIMKKGELVALGTPLELKAEHGTPLQFSILVEKDTLQQAVHRIREQLVVGQQWVNIQHNDAGNITVTVKKVQETEDTDGISVNDLSRFVKWLESDESHVSEYGFSNGSLEEVFLKVTQEGAAEVSTTPTQHDENNNADDQFVTGDSNGANLSSYTPKLSLVRQVRALVKLLFRLNWTGRRSMWSWIIYGLMVVASTIYGCANASSSGSYLLLVLPIMFLTAIIINASSIVYWDRNEGLSYYMSSQGMLQSSYLCGIGLYSLILYLVYGFILLSLLYMTPFFRPANLCDSESECDVRGFFNAPWTSIEYLSVIEFDAGGDNVEVYAYSTPAGYGKILGIVFTFMVTGPGSVLSASFLPGHKFGLVLVGLSVFMASLAPLFIYYTYMLDPKYEDCWESLLPASCNQTFTLDTMDHDFLDCVGASILSNPVALCIPPVSGLLPQIALLQSLGFLLVSNIRFVSQPPSYATEVLIPNINHGSCSGDTCSFPLANNMYSQYLGFMALGALLLLILGLILSRCYDMLVHGIARSSEALNQMVLNKEGIDHDENGHASEDLDEVQEEKRVVDTLIEPYLNVSSVVTHIEDPEFPPILTHSLQKSYPSLGGLPPKIALKSFDIQVPRGQVLGLLGKNGAGKTTVLKILSAAHEATSGLALVSGYNVLNEKSSVFENLGNCAQFDVFWPSLSVREHLEFLGQLKGLDKVEYRKAAQDIATAVGLGDAAVYSRQARRLSGGMRRRLSIACSLLCSPTVFLLDEPTTGLDPATRNSIWNLFTTFATASRSIIITTHMMIEADTLCNRIAIVSKGKLKVIGTQQYLKDMYGSGYLLQLNLVRSTQDHQDIAMQFVREHLHPDAQLQMQQGKTLRINIPQNLDLHNVFAALYNPQIRPASINQFLLSQSSLEDVFVAMGDN